MNDLLRSLGYFLLVPAAWGTYQAVKKPKKGEKVIFGSIAAVSLLLFMRSQAIRKDELLNVPDVELPDPAAINQTLVEGTEVTLTESFKRINLLRRCDALKDFNRLDDNHFIAVCNLFKRRRNITLRTVLNRVISGCINVFSNVEDKIIVRMNRLSIP